MGASNQAGLLLLMMAVLLLAHGALTLLERSMARRGLQANEHLRSRYQLVSLLRWISLWFAAAITLTLWNRFLLSNIHMPLLVSLAHFALQSVIASAVVSRSDGVDLVPGSVRAAFGCARPNDAAGPTTHSQPEQARDGDGVFGADRVTGVALSAEPTGVVATAVAIPQTAIKRSQSAAVSILSQQTSFWSFVFPIAAATAADVCCSNLAVSLAPVWLYTVAKSTSLCFSYAAAVFMGMQRFRWRAVGMVMVVFAGVALAAVGGELDATTQQTGNSTTPAPESASQDQQQQLDSQGRLNTAVDGTGSGVGDLWFPQGPLLLPTTANSNDSATVMTIESNAAAAAAAMDGGSFLTAGVPKTAQLAVPGATNQTATASASPRPKLASLLQQRALRSSVQYQVDALLDARSGRPSLQRRKHHHTSKHHHAKHNGMRHKHNHQADPSATDAVKHRRVLGEALIGDGGYRASLSTAQATLHPQPHTDLLKRAVPSSGSEESADIQPGEAGSLHSRRVASAEGDDASESAASEGGGWVLLGGLAALIAAACNAVRWIGVQRLLEEVERRATASESVAESIPSKPATTSDATGDAHASATDLETSQSEGLVEADWDDDNEDVTDVTADPGSTSRSRSPSSAPSSLRQAGPTTLAVKTAAPDADAATTDSSVLLSSESVISKDAFDLADESDGAALVIGAPETASPSHSKRQQASQPTTSSSSPHPPRAASSKPRAKLSPLFIMAWASPLSAALTAIVAVPAEGYVALSSPVWSSLGSTLGVLAGTALGAVLAFVMIGSELQVISRASAVSMTLAGHIKEALVILMGALVLGEAIGLVEGAGIAMVVLGTAAFGLLESNKH